MVTLRTVRGLVPGARARGAAGFSFRRVLTANELSELRDHGPGRSAAGRSGTKRTPGPGGKAGIAPWSRGKPRLPSHLVDAVQDRVADGGGYGEPRVGLVAGGQLGEPGVGVGGQRGQLVEECHLRLTRLFVRAEHLA